MVGQIAELLIRTAFGLVTYLALARFFMQAFRVPFRNPVGQFVVALTDWAVLPLRRFVPTARGLDLSTLVLAWLAKLLELIVLYSIVGGGLATAGTLLFFWSVLELFRACLYLAMFVVIVHVVTSWISPYSPLSPVFDALTRPLYAIFRRFIPSIRGIDLSPIFVLILIQVLLIALEGAPRMLLTGMR